MSKHLPPSKNKHVRPSERRAAPKRSHKRREEFKSANIFFLLFAAALLVAMRFVPLEGWMLRVAWLVPFFAAGWKIIIDAFDELFGGNLISEPVLVFLSGAAAMAAGHCSAAVIIMLAYSAVSIVRAYAELKKKRLLGSITSICPSHARLETAGGNETVPVERICVGDIICVSKGERIALDGFVVSGESEIDSYAITGNTRPIQVGVGSSLVSGCTNMGEELRVQVIRDYTESTVCRMVEYIEQYEDFKPRLFRQAETFTWYFTLACAILALIVAVLPPLFNSQWARYIEEGIALLTLAGPSTLFASVSLAYFGGIGGAVYGGALVKDANFLEALANSQSMVFARSGIITEGKYTVSGVFPAEMDEESLLSIAATAEAECEHPIAAAIRLSGSFIEPEEDEKREYETIEGKGVRAFFSNSSVLVGNAALMEENGVAWQSPVRPGTVVHVAIDGNYAGHIIVNDDIREGAFDAIEDLRIQGVKQTVLLTGGLRALSRKIAASLNFDMVKAELGPEAKIAAVEYLRATKNFGTSLAFVGNGTRDRRFMDCADVGIAMGTFGDYEALEAADVAIMDSDIRALPYIRKIALNAVGIAKLNFLISMGVKLLLVLFVLFGWLGISAVAIIDCFCSIGIIVNSFRTLSKI